ncbi:MAG: hypothetical protein ACXVW2_00735 [Nocardioidaceae bacterium]
MKRTLIAGIAAVLMIAVSACGGGSSSGGSASSAQDAKASKSISDAIMASQKGGAQQIIIVKRSEADCMGKGLVDKVGTDKLKSYGVLTKDLKTNPKKSFTQAKMSPADAHSAADVVSGCTNLKSMMMQAMSSQLASAPASVKTCIDNALNEQTLHDVYVKLFEGKQQAAGAEFTGPIQKCAMKATQH